MSAPSTTPSTTFRSSAGWYGGRKCIEFTQRVMPTNGADQKALGFNIPAFAEVVHVCMQNNAVATVTGTGAGATADSIHLVMYPITAATGALLTAAPGTATVKTISVTANSTSGILLGSIGIGTSEGLPLTSNCGKYRGLAVREICTAPILAKNPWSTEAYLALVPGLASSGSFQVHGTDITAGFAFDSATAATSITTSTVTRADVFVTLYVETYADNP